MNFQSALSSIKLFYLIIILHQIREATSYRVLYKQYFDKKIECNALTEIVKVDGTFSEKDQCRSSCKIDNNSGNDIFFLTVSSNDYTKGFEIVKDLDNFDYIVGVDLIYQTSEKFYIEIYDGSTFVEKTMIYKSILNNYLQEKKYNLQCGSTSLTSLHFQYKTSRNFINKKFKIRLTGFPTTYGIIKIKMWSNCVENCLTCQDSQNCNICQKGFQLYQLSTGQKVCSEVTPCKQSNCFQCARSIVPSFEICLQCFPGYTLNSSNLCDQNTGTTCKPTQYLDSDKICKNYSASCSMQNPNDSTQWQQCEQIPSTDLIKCPKDQSILLYDVENYLIRNCGCTKAFCTQCPTSVKCDKCVAGYEPINNECVFKKCPDGQVQNSTTLLCYNQGCTQNCSTCTATECTACLAGNYYIDKDNKLNCKLCNISNCASCDTSGQCNACNTGYQLNTARKCDKCQVKNCKECLTNDSQKCKTCNTNYELNSQIECKCRANNCDECTPEDGNICKQCVVGYQKNKSLCECSVSNCNKCKSTNGSICEICQNPNQTFENGKCICKIKDCILCNGTMDECNKCADGMYFNPQTKKCTCKIKNCLECKSDTICTKCPINYDDSNKQICKCNISNCDSCKSDDGSICEKCKLNFESNNTEQCGPTVRYCKDYDLTDGSKCNICQPNYKLTNSKCLSQVKQCIKGVVNDGNKCEECIQGFIPNQNKNECICQLINCVECELLPNNTAGCKKCSNGYVVDQVTSKCVKFQCQANNCEKCIDNNPNQCQICKENYEISNNECKLKPCKIIGCSKCDTNDLKKCIACANDYILNSIQICVKFEENKYSVKQDRNNEGINLTVTFQKNIEFDLFPSFESLIKFQILDFLDTDYKQTIKKINNKEILISLKFEKDCKYKKYKITFDKNFVLINNIEEQKATELENFGFVTESQIKQAEQAKAVTENVKTTLITTMLPIAMIGNFYVLFNTIDLTTFIYYLLYVKVRYPINITNFCGVFQNFQMAFIPNLFQAYWLDGYVQASTPTKFIENGADAYFLNGGGQSITIIIGILSIYGILKIISNISIYPPFQLYIQSKLESGWEYCGFFDLTWTVYMYVLVSCFLQLFEFEFDNSFCFVNYSLWALFFLAVLFIPVWITIFIIKTEDLNDTQIQKQYGSIIGGLIIPPNNYDMKNNNQLNLKIDQNEKYFQSNIESLSQVSPKFDNEMISQDSPTLMPKKNKSIQNRQKLQYIWSRYTNIFLYFRKILYAIFIIFLDDFPYIQLFTISLLNLFLAIHYFYIRPHINKVENIRNGLSEAMLIIMQCTICLLVNDNEDEIEQDRINIGWVLIACASFILLLHILFVVIDLLRGVFNLIKDFIHILVKFKQGFFENKRKQEEEKIRQEQAEKFAGMIPTVIGSNVFNRPETKRLTGMFIQNLNNSILNSPRRNRRMTQDQSFQVSANATTKVLELLSQQPLQISPKNKAQKQGSDAYLQEVSMIINSQYNLYEKRKSQLTLNQDLDISVNKGRSQGDKC